MRLATTSRKRRRLELRIDQPSQELEVVASL